ncbi:hypothetical protein bas68_0029 [Escherichia phage CarlSpitteler]|uniref:Uncharacterized protein n=1 Tax=Escherichia phage CarlSpitteler TaxID=2852039 RepID=A0AAE7VPY4_9CAUD|nr:hypothetical protein bas68_0029 [Escherichia phage CarlSpitteler]
MRNRNVIEAEIAKLEAELADVKEYECARDSAVHILKNLGWTRVRGKWGETYQGKHQAVR